MCTASVKPVTNFTGFICIVESKFVHFFFFFCSGQSGSGKTEATKLIVQYLSSMYCSRSNSLREVIHLENKSVLISSFA